MTVWQRPAYSIDLVLVIDATGSMSSLIDSVKSHALSLHEDLATHINAGGRAIDSLRVRVIAFRDFYADPAAESLVGSGFFDLPDERAGFAVFVSGLRATGGGDEPAGYPAGMPADIDKLTGLWDGPPYYVHPAWKRLLLIAPDVYPWNHLAAHWDATTHYPSRAGQGLRDRDYDSAREHQRKTAPRCPLALAARWVSAVSRPRGRSGW